MAVYILSFCTSLIQLWFLCRVNVKTMYDRQLKLLFMFVLAFDIQCHAFDM